MGATRRKTRHGSSTSQTGSGLLEEDEATSLLDRPQAPAAEEKDEPVTWMSIPRKGQLIVLACARLSEPLVQTSLRSYLFYQLKSFDPNLPDSAIASQAGIMQSAFAAAQLCTAMLWGRFSDQGGRKRVLLIGLFGTTISVLGFGFSTTFSQAMAFRIMGGALNGNVGVMRTMISEIVQDKKYQSRAFLLLPMCANAGIIIGPVLGGLLANPAESYPQWFGGIPWLMKFPYAPPNLLNACFLGMAACAVFFALDETHELHGQDDDTGRRCGRRIVGFVRNLLGKKQEPADTRLSDGESRDGLNDPESSRPTKRNTPRYNKKLPFRRIFTYNVICTLIAHSLLAFSQGTYQNIFFIFLSTPVLDPTNHPSQPPIFFTGGLGLTPVKVGFSMAILGVIGIVLQICLYPTISTRLGTVRAWRIFLYLFPVVYAATPFLALIPSRSPPPEPKTGPLVWAALTAVIFIRTLAGTFSTPAMAILINNCSPHPSVLGTIHGMGQSASSAARTIGPALGGWLLGAGLDHGVVGTAFWGLALMAVVTIVASNFVRDGNGHEIWLEGDEDVENDT
ncbi:major facilitator superfamily domain-containing protein [Pseudomassariella vexata]|uniref:Major facilitator superfamily domain-containing protein n=1 Tax=Pseudomassariella vexata TaxID=1141098 RepID=A0A1Y2DQL7_9PEZI|nr:major facilitator superfamily domain-containing protein [Pseudomassariella vexata]ORY61588.1 major facilitator superfamily domain-containing protein [Pseudomassariella vexata]